MSLRRLLSLVALLGVLVSAAAIPRHNALTLAGALQAAGERAAFAAVGISMPPIGFICRTDAGSETDVHALLACHGLLARAIFSVLIERVAFRDLRIGQIGVPKPRA